VRAAAAGEARVRAELGEHVRASTVHAPSELVAGQAERLTAEGEGELVAETSRFGRPLAHPSGVS
jgi:hypothetical protein